MLPTDPLFHTVRARLPCPYFKKVPLCGKNCRQENSPRTEKHICTQKTSTFCYTIPPGFTESEENTYGEMAPYTKLATTKRNL